MEYFSDNKTLCLKYRELVPDVMTDANYKHYKRSERIVIHGRGGNGSLILIEYESLPDKYQSKIRETLQDKYNPTGDPYLYASQSPILNAVKPNQEAINYFMGYELPDGRKIPSEDYDVWGKPQINYVKRYTKKAEWLDMLVRMTVDKPTLKRELNLTLEKFWNAVCYLIKTEDVALNKNPKRLKETIGKYQENGYKALITDAHRWGNDYSMRVDEKKLKSFLTIRNRHDDTEISAVYNVWAKENKKPFISHQSVGYWRKKWANPLIEYQEGKGKSRSALQKQISTNRASAPLLKINSDDNVLDLFFRKPKSIKKRGGKLIEVPEDKWFKLYLYIVKDTFNDLPLGYAVGYSITKEVVYSAYRDANRYVRRQLGDDYMWHQIQTDRWGINAKGAPTELRSYFEEQAIFTPAAARHANSKHIEASFNVRHHQLLKALFPKNYSGHNITSKEKLSPDTLDYREFPHINEAPQMIANFINALRGTKRKDCEMTLEQEWVSAFQSAPEDKKRLITPELRAKYLYKKHDKKNTITGQGVTPSLLTAAGSTQKCRYELSQDFIFVNRGEKVEVYYDPADLSEVMITNGSGIRQMVQSFDKANNAILDQTDWDRNRLNELQEEQKKLPALISKWAGENADRLRIEAEARVQAHALNKAQAHLDQAAISALQNGAQLKDIEQGNAPLPAKTKQVKRKKSQPKAVASYEDEW